MGPVGCWQETVVGLGGGHASFGAVVPSGLDLWAVWGGVDALGLVGCERLESQKVA